MHHGKSETVRVDNLSFTLIRTWVVFQFSKQLINILNLYINAYIWHNDPNFFRFDMFPVKNCFLQRNRFSVSVYDSYKHKLIIRKIFEYCLSSTSLWYMYVFSIYHFVRWYFGLNLWRLQFKYVQCIFLPNDCTSYEWRMET